MKKILVFMMCMAMCILLVSCGKGSQTQEKLSDGVYTAEVSLEGGTGKASIQSPATLTVENGKITAEIVWSSNKYDYMKVSEEKYLPVTVEPTSTFEIPVAELDAELTVIADTVAMSEPHEIEYTLTFHSDTLEKQE